MKEDWIECTLGDIAKIYNGNSINKRVKEEKYTNVDSGLSYIGTKDVQVDGKISYDTGVTIPFKEEKFKIAPKNSVLVCSEGGSAGKKTAFVEKEICFGNKLYAITNGYNCFESKYIYHYTRFNKFFDLFRNQMNGIIGGVSQRKFNKIIIPLSPLVEQKAIVKKIEELFSSLDSGISDLKKAQNQLVIYRQAVLKKAFEGELTKEWRAKQTNLPSADELLEQIKEERQKHYDQQLADWKEAVKTWEKKGKEGKKPSKPQKIKEFKEISTEDFANLPELPANWDWEKFGNVCLKIMDGTHFSPKNIENGDFKYITAKNIKEGRIDLRKISYVTKEDHREIYARCDVKKGDVLYIKDGATTGRAAINTFEEEFSLLSSVGVFRTSQNLILPKFLEHYLNAQSTRNRMLSNIAGVAITRLTLVKLNNSIFIICSPKEQLQIVQEIESRLSVCDKVEKDIADSLKKAQALRQSILKKAFEGKLLSEEEIAKCKADATYEPASALLERIKAEKSKK